MKPSIKILILISGLVTALVVLAAGSFINSRGDSVFADTNIPQSFNFQAPIFTNNIKNTERVYKENDILATVKNFDKRIYVLDQYFLINKSPLYGTAKFFTDACTKYNSPKDCTTVAAIAMNETHLCKYSNSAEMHNCWGFGGPGEHRYNFSSFQEGIDKVTSVLTIQYGNKYMIDPSKMELTFCGYEDNCTGWGNRIKFFMNQINDLSVSLGKGSLFDLRN